MLEHQEDTPPSSINGDEIGDMDDDEEMMYLEEVEEITLGQEDIAEYSDGEVEAEREPPEDHSILTFNKHSGSVFCCDLHPDGKIAVTGGEDDKAYVWSVESGNIIMECQFHKDSVIFTGFSFDGAYLATADMLGMIKVWKCNLENQDPWPLVFEYEADDIVWGQWHFGTRVLICGCSSGNVYILKIPSGETKVLLGTNLRAECGKLFHDGVRLAVGYEDGSLKIWDLKTNSALHHIQLDIGEPGVTAIDIHPENNLLASIASDGKVILATSNNGKVVGQLQVETDLETVAFCPVQEYGYLALGTLNGAVSIWDASRQMIRHHCAKVNDEDAAGVTKMIWVKQHLVTGCLDGSIRAYEGRSGEARLTLTGHLSEILDLCYNEKENIILSTSDDGVAKIFKCDVNKE